LTTPYATPDDVKSNLTGDTPNFSGNWTTTLTSIIADVQSELDNEVIQGRGITAAWSFVADSAASARQFTGRRGNRGWLAIDDCVSISSVTENGIALVAGVDYITDPIQGTPIVGLVRLNGSWSFGPGAITVVAKWGYAITCPGDVHRATITESIRVFLANRAGNDDRLGITPFGQVVTSKAFTNRTLRLISRYSRAGGIPR